MARAQKKPDQGKKAKNVNSKEVLPETVTAADLAYEELRTTEKVNHIAVLRELFDNLTSENNHLTQTITTKAKEYAERITAIRSKIGDQCEEIARLTGVNHQLINERNKDLRSYEVRLEAENAKIEDTKERLSGEIKILNSKLNDLEGFHAQREDLMDKHDAMRNRLKELEERSTGIVNVYRRLDLINKDRMGQELKDRLLKLSIEFQEASQPAATKSLIRENIAINNELGGQIGSWQKLYSENHELKKRRAALLEDRKAEAVLSEKSLSLGVLQTQIIDRLAYEHNSLGEFYEETANLETQMAGLEQKCQTTSSECDKVKHQLRLLFQQKHDLMTQANVLEQHRRALLGNIQQGETVLRKTLLYVAEGQDWKRKRNKGRLSNDELLIKLKEIFKTLMDLYSTRGKPPELSEETSQEVVWDESIATIYDPDYAKNFWRGHGVFERSPERDALAETEGKRPSDGSQSGSEDS